MSFNVPLNATCDSTIQNTAFVSSSSTDPNSSNNTSQTVNTTVDCQAADADLYMEKTGPATVIRGGMIDYTLTVTNDGPGTATDVVVSDQIPSGLTFNTGASSPACSVQGVVIVCTTPSLNPGASMAFAVTFDVETNLQCNSRVYNQATASASTNDPNGNNNTSQTVSTLVECPSDLTIQKVGPATIQPGEIISYTVLSTNNSPNIITNLHVSDLMQAGLSFDPGTSSPECVQRGIEVECGTFTLNPGASQSYTVSFLVSQQRTCGSQIINVVDLLQGTSDLAWDSTTTTVVCQQPECSDGIDNDNDGATDYPADFACDSPQDDDESDRLAECQDTIDNDNDGDIDFPADIGCSSNQDDDEFNLVEADLSIVKSGAPIVIRGSTLLYTLTATNNGPDTATNVSVTDQIPTGLIFDPLYSDPECIQHGSSVVCNNIATLASGQSRTFGIAFTVPNTVACDSTLDNRASVSGSSTDTNPGNNQSNIVYTDVQCAAQPECSDGIDNDNDGATDYPDDFACDSPQDDDESDRLAECQDTIDNDNDGDIDFPVDQECDSPQDDDEDDGFNPICDDGIDNDGDGLTDYPQDPGCSSLTDDSERDANGPQCDNGIDDSDPEDTIADYPADPGCTGPTDDDETDPVVVSICDDGIDNDGDGLTDYPADPGCSSLTDDSERDANGPQCDNGIDDSDPEDTIADYPADPGCTGPTDDDETDPVVVSICDDGIDNDGDGEIDFPDDPGCSSASDDDEKGTTACDNGIDDDNDGLIDFQTDGSGDPECVSPEDQDEQGGSSSSSSSSTTSSSSSSSSSSSCTGDPDITISLYDSADPVDPDERFTYTMRITNNSNSCTVDDLDARLILDLDTDFVSASNNGSHNNGTVTWNDLDIGTADFITRTVDVRVDDNADDGDVLRAIAFADNDSDDETTRVDDGGNGGDEEITISVVDDRDPVETGDSFSYRIRINNNENSEICTDVRAFLDSDTSFLNASDDGDEDGNDEVVWEDFCIDGDDSETLRLEVRVRNSARDGDRLRLRVRAEDEEDTEFTLVRDDIPPVCVGGNCYPDPGGTGIVTIDKSADRSEVQPGSTLMYTLSIRNISDGVAHNLTIEDRFTAGSLTVEDAGGGYPMGNGVRWDIPTMGPSETRVIRYRVRVSPSMRHGQVITNNVEIIGADFNRPATDSTQVYVIENLPQTGETSFTGALDRNNSNLRLVTPGLESNPSVPFVIWTTIITMGMSAGSVLGKRMLF